jgi:hypothetical protein
LKILVARPPPPSLGGWDKVRGRSGGAKREGEALRSACMSHTSLRRPHEPPKHTYIRKLTHKHTPKHHRVNDTWRSHAKRRFSARIECEFHKPLPKNCQRNQPLTRPQEPNRATPPRIASRNNVLTNLASARLEREPQRGPKRYPKRHP